MNVPAALAKVGAAMTPEVRKASLFIGPRLVVSMCRRHKFSRRNTREDFVVKVGAPNYLERAFIAACKKAQEPLPLKRVQLKLWPKKKA